VPSSSPQRIRLSRKKWFKLNEYSRKLNGLQCRKVDRTTKWGNPFRLGVDGDIDQCLAKFRNLINQSAFREQWMHLLEELRGKNLACWCPLDQKCHADVLLELANQ
jgi:hypothetical protein